MITTTVIIIIIIIIITIMSVPLHNMPNLALFLELFQFPVRIIYIILPTYVGRLVKIVTA
jgi:hypothetical protein